MLHTLRKIPQQISGKTWKALLYSVLFASWAVILGGTFILLN
jgi:hypothetical protein